MEPASEASLLCKYPSKKCWAARAVKRNGERHNLCEEHRAKANSNQRRLERKRKAQTSSGSGAGSGSGSGAGPASADAASKPRKAPRTRPQPKKRGVLSTHLAMREELRARQVESLLQLRRSAARAAIDQPPGAFVQLLEHELPRRQRLRISTAADAAADADTEALERDAADELALLCGSLDAAASTSPVDVAGAWHALDAAAGWDLPLELEPADGPVARV